MPFVEVEGGRLFYQVAGKGPPLVLIHGAWASHEWWRWQIPELARSYHVMTPDVRGHGRSIALVRSYSVDGLAEDLDIVLHEAEISKTVLVGWSLGGIISMAYCLKHPSRVTALVLIATRGHRDPKLKLRLILQYLQARLSLLMDFTAPRKYDREGERFPSQSFWLQKELENMLSTTSRKEVLEWARRHISQNPRQNFFEVAKSFWNWEAGEALKGVGVPTLIMVGDKDIRTPPHFSHLLNDTIPDSRLIVVEGAGHCLPLEYPERVNAEIIGFLKGMGY